MWWIPLLLLARLYSTLLDISVGVLNREWNEHCWLGNIDFSYSEDFKNDEEPSTQKKGGEMETAWNSYTNVLNFISTTD